MLSEAGFTVDVLEPYSKHRPLTSLTEGVSRDNAAKIHSLLAELPPTAKDALNLVHHQGELYLNHWYVLVVATD